VAKELDKIILLGGGGHAKVLIDLIRTSDKYEIAGILDPQIKRDSISGISVLGEDDLLQELYDKGIRNACIGIGSIKDNSKRKRLYENVKQLGFDLPGLIHPESFVSSVAQISEGAQVMAGAIVQTGSTIGINSIVNTGAIIEHHCVIGKHVHICPGVVLSGESFVDDEAFIGAGSTVIQGIKIGKGALVAAGAVVVNDVPDGVRVMGAPAKSR
jgi:UDP-perosamine 4-acetyltransferase